MKIYLSLFVLALLALCFFPVESHAAVWSNVQGRSWLGPVSNDPSSTNARRTWEDAYSQWVHDKVGEGFFISQDSPAYNIATDCAEAQYTFRIIFASQYGLPFSTAGGRISNQMSDFDNVQEGSARVRAFIRYVIGDQNSGSKILPKVNTTTLSADTYPIAINTKYVRPGTIFLYKAQHSMIVHEVSPFGVLSLLFASVPKQVWHLKLRTEITQAPEGSLAQPADGLRLWRHPELGLKPQAEPGYSVEQFNYIDPANNPDHVDYGAMIESRLQSFQENPELAIRRASINIATALLERARLVNDGLIYKKYHPYCLSQSGWEQQSTVHKDKNIKVQFARLQQSIDSFADSPGAVAELSRIRGEIFAMTELYYSPTHHTVYKPESGSTADSDDVRLDLGDLQNSYLSQTISSDPNDTLEARWGLDGSGLRSRCPQYPD